MNKSANDTIIYMLFFFMILLLILYLYQQGLLVYKYNENNTINNNNNIINTISNDEKKKIIKEHYMPIIKKNKAIGPAFGFHEYFDKFHNKMNTKTLGWRNWWINNKTDFSKLPHDPNFTNISPIHKWDMDRYIN